MRLALVVVFALPLAARADTPRDYVVVEGDTCLGIAYRELGDAGQLGALHAINPQLGKLPHKLVPGQVLKLPGRGPAAADAHLRSLRGRVEVLPAGTERWDAGSLGQELFRTWRVGTRARATAKVEFKDLTTLDMREDTVVMIFGPTAGNRSTLRTQLDRGVLRTRMAALDKKVVVETPAGKAELGAGSALVDVDAAKETRVANHTGKSAKLANARGKVELQAGYGSRVVADKPPSPPIKLLPPPRWETGGELALAWAGDPITLRGRWRAVPGAVKYRIEIASATSPLEVESQVEVPEAITRLEATGLPAGTYLVTVASVDRDGLEGVPSAPLMIQAGEVPRPRDLAGHVFEPPIGLRCARGEAPPAADPAPPVVLVGQPVRVTCISAIGHTTLELALPAPRIAWPPAHRRLRRGELVTVEVGLAELDPAHLDVIAQGLAITRRARAGDLLQLDLVAASAGPAELRFELDGVAIATEAVTVIEPGESIGSSAPGAGARWRWGIGGYGGATLARDADTTLLGAELWLAPQPWLAPYLGIAKLSDAREGTIRGGIRTVGARLVNPVARAGIVVVGSEHVAGELGGGVELVRGAWGVRGEAVLVGSGRDVFVQGVIGLTFSR